MYQCKQLLLYPSCCCLALLLKLIVYAFVLSSDLVFFALILSNPQKYHRCKDKGINDIMVFIAKNVTCIYLVTNEKI